jgi:hypothetical protein
MSRIKSPKKVEKDFFYDYEDFRFGTPKEVAEYRAKRLACNRLIEVGAGVGFQTAAFAKTCKEVVAIEIDERRVKLLQANIEKHGLKNVKVIHGDALSENVISDAGKADYVFVDTERPEAEKSRTIESIRPSIQGILDSYLKKSKGVCVEVPPHLEVNLDCEKEHISLDGKLNRLNLYFTGLKKCKRSVVLLPSGERIEGDGKKTTDRAETIIGFKFLYEPNPAVVLAGLAGEISAGMKSLISGKKEFLVSTEENKSPFLSCHKILAVCADSDALQVLKSLKCGHVLPRYNIEPSLYWTERKRYEKGLTGENVCHLFKFGDQMVICAIANARPDA